MERKQHPSGKPIRKPQHKRGSLYREPMRESLVPGLRDRPKIDEINAVGFHVGQRNEDQEQED